MAAAIVMACGSAVSAQPTSPDQVPRAVLLDGTSFAGVELPIAPVDGIIALAGQRAWVWSTPGDGPTRRVVLEGDVRVTLGRYEFRAERAAVWLDRIDDRGGAPVYQVYAVFDDVRTPTADAAIAVEADRLPVQGVIAPIGEVVLRADVTEQGPPPGGSAGVFEGEARATFAHRLGEVTGAIPPEREFVERAPAIEPLARHLSPPSMARRSPPDAGDVPPAALGDGASAPVGLVDPLFVSQGTFAVSVGDRVVVQTGERANAAILSGGVSVQYSDPRGKQSLELAAERGVIFLRPGSLADQLGSLSAEDVDGIYLEGEVLASNGTYTLRGPRVYYDVPTGRAVVLDAVFWTYDQQREMPLYVRADSIRQQASDTFVAEHARLANTAFANPHFTIGASDVTVTVYEDDVNQDRLGGRSHVDARNLTIEGASVPVMWFPLYKGDPEQFPLRGVQVSDSNRRGFGIQTTWNAFALLGIEPPPGVNADLQLDYFADSGFGIGIDAGWDRENSQGSITGYFLPDDSGKDVSQNGTDVDREGESRGFVVARHMQEVGDKWLLRLEGGYVSDELFLDSYFPRLALDGPEITNRLHLSRTDVNSQLSFELKGQANDFISNQWLLQSPGYFVDKLPEVGYVTVANDIFAETHPGLLTHTWEASLSLMRFRFSEATAADYGYRSMTAADRAFGTLPGESLGDAFRMMGLNEDFVTRFDTRHELSLQLNAGPVQVTPFVVGRITAYDSEFEDYSPSESDQIRLWGSAGVKVSTQLQRVNDSVRSGLFDLNRIRHIVEPSVTVWHSGTNIDQVDLPVYDDDVESLADGSAVRVGVDQTWQTKRGGPGRWRSVDVLSLNAAYVWSSNDVDRESPIGRFYESRPELSQFGEFVEVDAVWRASEVVALAGEVNYDIDRRDFNRWSGGVLLQHTPSFRTSAEIRSIDSQGSTYGVLSAGYEMSDKYTLDGRLTYNFDEQDFQTVAAQLYRRFPNGSLGLTLVYDNIRGETSFGFVFRPAGLRQGAGLGSNDNFRFGG
ncbi:MAG: hypothetical protein DHS20C14_16230 [Phycisphaeraceae bacterium]|nr:MAG: hypothetical protein DHS20C14_16230 [Phycisphaeraceae bacterium]